MRGREMIFPVTGNISVRLQSKKTRGSQDVMPAKPRANLGACWSVTERLAVPRPKTGWRRRQSVGFPTLPGSPGT